MLHNGLRGREATACTPLPYEIVDLARAFLSVCIGEWRPRQGLPQRIKDENLNLSLRSRVLCPPRHSANSLVQRLQQPFASLLQPFAIGLAHVFLGQQVEQT